MKKVILSLVFVLATGTSLMNLNANNKKTIDTEEDFGCRGTCNAIARQAAIALATDHVDRSTEGELFRIWGSVYMSCVVVQC